MKRQQPDAEVANHANAASGITHIIPQYRPRHTIMKSSSREAISTQARSGAIDLTRSIPPIPPSFADKISGTLRGFSNDKAFSLQLRNGIAGGSDADRKAGVKWLRSRFGEALCESRLLVTNGTQSAIQLLFEHLVGKDGLLLAEELSYGVLSVLAARAHIRVKGVGLDEYGVVPDEFERCCQELKPKALYCNPTIQNPTTTLMSHSRRLEIAEIARRYGVAIIEDEPLGKLHPDAPPPIASLAPDITWYVMGLTKCLTHGLRVAYMVGPSEEDIGKLFEPVRRLSHWFPSPLSSALATTWIEDGSAEDLCAEIRQESLARQSIAASILAGLNIASPAGAMHLWLRLPEEICAEELTRMLLERSVLVRPASLFAVENRPVPNALRLSLSSPLERNELERALETLATFC